MLKNANYFIKKFKAIPDNKWTTHTRHNDEGQHCALGHCHTRGSHLDEEQVLKQLFLNGNIFHPNADGWRYAGVAAVNNGEHPDFQYSTPKLRILAALNYIKDKEHERSISPCIESHSSSGNHCEFE